MPLNNPPASPVNYREIPFTIGGKNTTVGGMARPDYEDSSTAESMTYLFNQNYDVIIGLSPEREYALSAMNNGIDYLPMEVEDFSPPSIEVCEEVYEIIKKATEHDKKVGIHCGEGFGRTGTLLAAVKLKELMLAMDLDDLKFESNTTETHVGEYGGDRDIRCTELVQKAIDEVRAIEGSKDSVEISSQVNRLVEYQKYLTKQLRGELVEKTKYKPAIKAANGGRFHAYTADGSKFKDLKESFRALKGDLLKTKILEEVSSKINDISSPEELAEFKETFKSSEEYNVLKTSQGVATKLFGLKTSSVKAFDKLIEEKETELDNSQSLDMS